MASTKIIKSVDNMGEWADKINARVESVVGHIVNTAGETEYYTDIDLMFADKASDVSIVINSGSYDIASKQDFSSLSNFSIVCNNGKAILRTKIPTGVDQSAWSFEQSSDMTIRNIDFVCNLDSAEYGSGHAYNVVSNSISGTFDNCGFIMISSLDDTQMVPPSHSIGFVHLPKTGNLGTDIKGCYFAAFNTAVGTSANTQLAAVHYSTGDDSSIKATTFDACDFIGSQVLLTQGAMNLRDFVDGTPRCYGCRTTVITPFLADVDTMRYADAVSKLPDAYKPLLLQSETYKWSKGLGDGYTQFYSISGTDTGTWYDVVKVKTDDIDGRSVAVRYRLEIFASVSSTGVAESIFHYDVITIDGVTETHIIDQYGSLSLVQFTNDGSNLVMQVKPNAGNPVVKVEGKVKLTPTEKSLESASTRPNVYLEINEEN